MVRSALVVDDDSVSRLLLSHMLSEQGFGVCGATGVDDALDLCQQTDFALIVCDYLMPDKDGLDLLDALGEESPPFILLTGHADRESLADDRVERVSSYLTKPVSTAELTAAVDEVLQSQSA